MRYSEADCDLNAFKETVERRTDLSAYPRAEAVERNMLVYAGERVRAAACDQAARLELQSELARALLDGPGAAVVRRAFGDLAVVDRATAVFEELIAEEKAQGSGGGDHFAQPGANDRLWNALEKTVLRAPEVFADYYANDAIALTSEAWLGPGYQVTSQVNVVNPGAKAQSPHRDYHLGFASNEEAASFPAHVHRLSPLLTLQGAVAHCDMPVDAGPTKYLPYSQLYEPGYLAWRLPEFQEYFERHCVQLPLEKGDAVFFNPAVFHAAGANGTTDVRRVANLLQISSAMGRAMEAVSRTAMVEALLPVLRRRRAEGAPEVWLNNVIAASAEGYPFPADLDRDPPVGGMAPESQAARVRGALDADQAQ